MAGIGLSTTLRNARATAIRDAFDANASPGYIQFYTSPRPATGAAITSQTLLGTVTLSKPSGSVSNGVLTFDTITSDTSADASGAAVWARGYDGAGTFVADFDVTDNAGVGPIKLNNINIVAGGTISITSGTIAEGNA
jgi:hypothetical protein